MNELTPNVKELIEFIESYCPMVQIISYGLAPNPNGFCYEILDGEYKTPTLGELERFEQVLNNLSINEVNSIKKLYL